MLSAILSKSECANCKFCCSFRRQSLWETPIFDSKSVEEIKKLYPNVQFKKVGKSGKSFTFSILQEYKTDNPQEEVACPFLDSTNGCTLPSNLKPFDCSIWPFRPVYKKEKIGVALTPTCPVINKISSSDIKDLVQNGLGKKILEHAKSHPDIIKEESDFLSNIVY